MRKLAGGHHATWPRLPILGRRGDGEGVGQRKGGQGSEKGTNQGQKVVLRGRERLRALRTPGFSRSSSFSQLLLGPTKFRLLPALLGPTNTTKRNCYTL